jgi:anti-sigma B factor antagonist
MSSNYDIDVTTEAGALVVTVAGELDLSARTGLADEVVRHLTATADPTRLALDLGDVTFCDSSGLGALLDIRRAAGEAGVEMVLQNVPPPVARVLDLTDVDGWLLRE